MKTKHMTQLIMVNMHLHRTPQMNESRLSGAAIQEATCFDSLCIVADPVRLLNGQDGRKGLQSTSKYDNWLREANKCEQ